MDVDSLAATLVLGALFDELRSRHGAFEVLEHWTQGEFHHDLVIEIADQVLVVATNCNGGIKEVLLFDARPTRESLWSMRCPENPEFSSPPPARPLSRSTTLHWFDPCELLRDDARSELLADHRERQPGGGWVARGCSKK
jgi:hypothetical protein